MAGVDVEDREGDLARLERLGRQVQQDGRVLAAAEEEDGAFRLGRHLADDEDGQRLQQVEMAQGVAEGTDQGGHGRVRAAPGRRGEPVGGRGSSGLRRVAAVSM